MFPAPASNGAAISISHPEPSRSTANQSLVGPVQPLNTGQGDATNWGESPLGSNPLRQELSADLADGHRPNNTAAITNGQAN